MPRIAIISIMLEVNSFSPVTKEEDFRNSCYLVGDEILEEAAKAAPILAREIKPFIQAMNESGAWTPVPTVCTYYEPWGPISYRRPRRPVLCNRPLRRYHHLNFPHHRPPRGQ